MKTTETFLSAFGQQGKQGRTGTFLNARGEHRVFKFDLDPGFGVEREDAVMRALASAFPAMPHHARSFGVAKRRLTPSSKSARTPWKGSRLWPLDCLEMEYLGDARSLSSVARSSAKKAWSAVQQMLCANHLLREAVGFAHCDLHSDNVLVGDSPFDVHVYSFPDGRSLAVPTHGALAKAIDFGFSRVDGLGASAPPSVSSTQLGFVGCAETADPLVDARLLLNALREERGRPLEKAVASFLDYFSAVPWDRERGWIALDLDVEAYLARGLAGDGFVSDDPTSLFEERNLADVAGLFLLGATTTADPIDPEAAERFRRAWRLVEDEVRSPFEERLALKEAARLLAETLPGEEEEAVGGDTEDRRGDAAASFATSWKGACPWLGGVPAEVLGGLREGLALLGGRARHLLGEARAILKDSLDRRYAAHAKGTPLDWLLDYASKHHRVAFRRKDRVAFYPSGRSLELDARSAERLSKAFASSAVTTEPCPF